MDKIRCQKCGSENNVEFCTVDGVCDENGNSIGVPLCADCEESDAYDEAYVTEGQREAIGNITAAVERRRG
jgi:hypothetical protein